MNLKLSSVAKAIVAAVVAGASALGVAAQDGVIDTADSVTIALAVLGGLGITWAVPNKPKAL